jgi:hypothetical protein
VRELPPAEYLEFAAVIAPRLAGKLARRWIEPVARTVLHRWPLSLDDAEILALVFDTVFCRFLTFALDPADEAAFAEPLAAAAAAPAAGRRAEQAWFKLDFSAIRGMRLLPGIYAAPVVALGVEERGARRLVAMRIGGFLLRPEDQNAWARARYFLLQAAGLHATLVHHTPLHFQYDAIAAVTATVLPEEHLLRRLLRPHFRFSLALNQAALHSPLSILSNHPLLPFATFPFDRASVHRFQAIGWSGIEGNSAYPAHRFSARPRPVHGELGRFLELYYAALHPFVERVVERIPPDDAAVRSWANALHEWLPGFPDATAIAAPGILADVATACVWGPSVVHSTEHFGLAHHIPLGAIPLRLREPPPFSRVAAPLRRERLATREDELRQRMAWEVLIRGGATTRLDELRYGFADPTLREANDELRASLRRLDANLPVRRFAPLSAMAQSIQI